MGDAVVDEQGPDGGGAGGRHPVPFAVPDIDDSDVAAVEAVLRSGWITTGEQALGLESELAAYLDVPHVVAVSSCTAAIEIAYASLDLPAGAKVGVPTWTFASSALAPHHHGAMPVLLDVDGDTLNVSPGSLERALDAGLDAVVVVHFAGTPVERAVLDLCADAGVPVIEDSAHSLGASDHRGRSQGQGSVAACLSFYATKNLTSAEGGALVTDHDDVAAFARAFRLHGLSTDAWDRYRPGRWRQYDLVAPGIKANLPDVLAALARSQLARFDAMQARRAAAVARYVDLLADVDRLSVLPGPTRPGSAHHLLVVTLDPSIDRSRIISDLAADGIATSVHFQPLHRFGWFEANAEVGPGGVTMADHMADRVLSLPLSSAMELHQVERVCESLRSAVERR